MHSYWGCYSNMEVHNVKSLVTTVLPTALIHHLLIWHQVVYPTSSAPTAVLPAREFFKTSNCMEDLPPTNHVRDLEGLRTEPALIL